MFNTDHEVLLIEYPARRGGGWSFPKGHIDEGETVRDAAVREVFEEGHARAEIVHDLGSTEYVNHEGVPRRIHWFVMRTESRKAKPEKGFRAGYYPVADALERLTHEDNRELLVRAATLLGIALVPS